MKRVGLLVCILLVFTMACHSNYGRGNYGYVKSYQALDTHGVAVEPLKPGQVPQLIYSNNFNRDFDELVARAYVPVGNATFFGAVPNEYEAKYQAEAFGASVGLFPAPNSQELHLNAIGTYFAKQADRPRIGIIFRDLYNEDKRGAETNTGAVVKLVVEDTPAFSANILPGDVVIEIAEQRVRNSQTAYALLEKEGAIKGSKVPIKLIRNKAEKTITIEF
jgi:hypothetical protein